MRSTAHRALQVASAATVLVLAGCSAEPAVIDAARRTFHSYQEALVQADTRKLRRVLARESRVLVPHIPFERARDAKPLVILGAEQQPPRVLLAVSDPNDGDRETTFVLVKEDGDLRVDLVATTAFNHKKVAAANPGQQLSPRSLSVDELARIRSQQPESFR